MSDRLPTTRCKPLEQTTSLAVEDTCLPGWCCDLPSACSWRGKLEAVSPTSTTLQDCEVKLEIGNLWQVGPLRRIRSFAGRVRGTSRGPVTHTRKLEVVSWSYGVLHLPNSDKVICLPGWCCDLPSACSWHGSWKL